ncbi:MAG TPA: hypothetical protein VM490_12230 [Armatimonadaceae bacterium]|jgi:hypothetical protein|nr:hypothetical protein [Armatimonadaceae bacterium]
MSFPKKGRRTIQIGDEQFFWSVSGSYLGSPHDFPQKVIFRLTVSHSEHSKSLLFAAFHGDSYRFLWAEAQDVAVTPRIVREVIEYARRQGWDPKKANEHFTIEDAGAVVKANAGAENLGQEFVAGIRAFLEQSRSTDENA